MIGDGAFSRRSCWTRRRPSWPSCRGLQGCVLGLAERVDIGSDNGNITVVVVVVLVVVVVVVVAAAAAAVVVVVAPHL